MPDLYGVDFGFIEMPNLCRVTNSIVLPASSKEQAIRAAKSLCQQQIQRVFDVAHVHINWWDDLTLVVEKDSSVVGKTETSMRDGWRKPLPERLQLFLNSGEVSKRMMALTDRQVGQLVWDYLGSDLSFGFIQTTLWREAAERLRRSVGGRRTPKECFNAPESLITCSRCDAPMLRVVGIDEPDYLQCVSVACGHKQRPIQ